MMVLYHLHNPTAPAFAIACNRCTLGYACKARLLQPPLTNYQQTTPHHELRAAFIHRPHNPYSAYFDSQSDVRTSPMHLADVKVDENGENVSQPEDKEG
uniref:Uncharacterized protein n=1 Tax=Tanacetum cinerariifolium TaxID=118510 RepID=A0A6L2M4G6_TANCI|nr:hypothetical protein [Tanacetum cinerariifolium]